MSSGEEGERVQGFADGVVVCRADGASWYKF